MARCSRLYPALAPMVCVVLLLYGAGVQAAPLQVSLPDFPPFVRAGDGRLGGEVVSWLRRTLTSAGLEFRLHGVPNFGRAFREVSLNRADVFGPATRNPERDRVAVFLPIPFQNPWCWFVPSARTPAFAQADAFRSGLRIGTLINSNTQFWLEHHGYPVAVAAPNVETLPRLLLDYNRLDAVLLSKPVFVTAARAAGVADTAYSCVLSSEKALGLYVSRTFVQREPALFRRLQAAVASGPEQMQQQHIAGGAGDDAQQRVATPVMHGHHQGD